MLRDTNPPTAIFCDDDLLAAGALLAARSIGIEVPDQLSIVGFAGTILSEVTTPQITTVAADAEGLGALGVRSVVELINGEGSDATHLSPMSLAVRGSTGAVADSVEVTQRSARRKGLRPSG